MTTKTAHTRLAERAMYVRVRRDKLRSEKMGNQVFIVFMKAYFVCRNLVKAKPIHRVFNN